MISNNLEISKQYNPAFTSSIFFSASVASFSSIIASILLSLLIILPYPVGSLIIPVKIVAASFSFSDFSTTVNVYAHLDINSKLLSAEAISSAFSFKN